MTPMTTRSFSLRAPLLALGLALGGASALSGCVPLALGGAAAGTAVVATDRRTSGAQLDDKTISLKVENQIAKQLGDTARVNASVYEGRVLLTGDVPTEAAKTQAGDIARKIEKVRIVNNQLNVGPITPLGDRSNDAWLSSKVRAALLETKYVPSGTISTTTERGVVYLMGKVTQQEGDYAATAAAGVSGVVKVVKLFDTISREEAIRLSGNTTTSAPEGGGTPPAQQAPIESGTEGASGNSGGGLEVMPVK